jgi:signal transduction histidine kinase
MRSRACVSASTSISSSASSWVLRQVLSEISPDQDAGASNAARVADLIEAAVSTAVRSYVDARDFAARQREAEHISFLTHELRNPLSVVKLAASRLRRAVQEHEALFEVLERNLDRLMDLLDGVLQVGRLQAGKVEPVQEPRDPLVAHLPGDPVQLTDRLERALAPLL